ncbi:MAG: cytochrome c biogenesis protein CcsA [Cyclobacteriaceae bacterium]
MKVFKFLFSGTLMGILLIIFAVAIGYATFIENDYDAITAKMLIYNARWFEILLLLMVMNFTGMIFTRKLYRKDQLNILIIHLSLILIIIGAGITRYIGFEGIMHIRNGQTTNVFTTTDTYLSIDAGKEIIREKVMLSGKSKDFYNKKFSIDGENFDFTIKNYNANAVQKLIRSPIGSSFISLSVAHDNDNHEIYVKEGESESIHELGISFGDTTILQNVHIVNRPEGLMIRLPLNYKSRTQDPERPSHSKFVPFKPLAVYKFSGMSLVLKEYIDSAFLKYVPSDKENQGSKVIDISLNETETFLQFDKPKQLSVGGKNVKITIGALPLQLPFSLKLVEFQLERYPGSNSPSSFASEIVLIDEEENLTKPYRIFMNNILSYKGYRFYQSSYHQDELGTVLSVNQDYWGTLVTYIGYFLLFGSLIVAFFTKKTRFSGLLWQFDIIRKRRKELITGIIVILTFLFGTPNASAQQVDNLSEANREHAAAFGRLQIQSSQGRMMPINTMASKMLVKVYKKDTYEGFTADQVFLEIVTKNVNWIKKPMIKVGHEELKKVIGIQGDYARYIDFFSQQGVYKLTNEVNDAYIKKPALRTKFDKELIQVDERVNVFTMAIDGSILRIFPIPFHPNNTWGIPTRFELATSQIRDDSLFTTYLKHLLDAKKTNQYEQADKALKRISDYQKEAGKAIVLSDRKVSLEVFYNQTNIFKSLFPIYLTLGVFLTGLFFIQIFKPSYQFKTVTRVFSGILFLTFLVQTFGLILRWYLSGHAPWSNGYESMLYISWVTVLSGLIFMKKSTMALAVTSLLAGITLLTAHLSWMNPEITNLVPVLKSYWLTIHVATITASYGFLGLGAMLAFMNLCIMIFRNRKNLERVNLIVEELSIIVEMALMIGLVLIIIGNFLGGIWANESWGRYWGWDPKETWTLVAIITYSFILHMRMIPNMRSQFSFNFLSLIGFSTILMTYFGVNYYLSGLHSYAQGDPVPVPTFVYYLLAVITIVSALAAINGYRMAHADRISEGRL